MLSGDFRSGALPALWQVQGGPPVCQWPARNGLPARGRRDLGLAAKIDAAAVDAVLARAVHHGEYGLDRGARACQSLVVAEEVSARDRRLRDVERLVR